MAGANRLARETSPYLLQHAHNPVDWFPWGDEAFATARAHDKPILLSIGYSSCHWCHVMERESFEDPAVAGLMNELFVNVKVDREERPDVDDVYMRAVQLLIGRGGWPLTVFCTPDGKPFHGGTYFPPEDRHGLPGFPRVLRAVAQAYREKAADIDRVVGQLVDGVRAADETGGRGSIDPTLPRRAADALLAHVDRDHGGLGGAPKFPHTQAFQLMLRHGVGRSPALVDAAVLTCRRMAAGGMYDQIGGGFHRYSVDAAWLVPHFEKMLYDNAQLPRLYLEAWQATGDTELRRVATDVCDYVLRELRTPDGGFHSATDADSEGEEGRFFVWTPAEVAAAVDAADVDLVCRFWDITDVGNFEGRSIPHVTSTVDQAAAIVGRTPAEVAAALAKARCRLYGARAKRIPPGLDDKVLTSWNALMIGTLATVGRVLGEPRFVDAARAAADFLWSAVRRDGRLLHQWTKGEARQDAFLDDHAFLAAACLDLHEATGEPVHLQRAVALIDALDARFHDADAGGYFFTPHDGEALIARTKSGADGSIPSGNAVAAVALLRLHDRTGDARHRERAEEILRLYQDAAARNPFGYATWLEALDRWAAGATEIVVVGRRDDPAAAGLWRVAREAYVPLGERAWVEPDVPDEARPAFARERVAPDGRATAWVCRAFACSAPVHDPAALADLLRRGASDAAGPSPAG